MPYNAEFDDSASEDRVRSYRDRFLTNWAIVCLLPNMQRVIVGRFRTRADADGHLRVLRQMMPCREFIVVFDCENHESSFQSNSQNKGSSRFLTPKPISLVRKRYVGIERCRK